MWQLHPFGVAACRGFGRAGSSGFARAPAAAVITASLLLDKGCCRCCCRRCCCHCRDMSCNERCQGCQLTTRRPLPGAHLQPTCRWFGGHPTTAPLSGEGPGANAWKRGAATRLWSSCLNQLDRQADATHAALHIQVRMHGPVFPWVKDGHDGACLLPVPRPGPAHRPRPAGGQARACRRNLSVVLPQLFCMLYSACA